MTDKQKLRTFKKATKAKGYLELCRKNLMDADDKISWDSPEHAIIKNVLSDIRATLLSVNQLISRTTQ